MDEVKKQLREDISKIEKNMNSEELFRFVEKYVDDEKDRCKKATKDITFDVIFEIIAALFYKDTGFLAPGKDDPLPHDIEDRQIGFNDWNGNNRDLVATIKENCWRITQNIED